MATREPAGIRPAVRLALQAAIVGVSFSLGGVVIDDLGNLFGYGPVRLGWLAWPFTIVCACALINAINLMDGLDGLAAAITGGALLLTVIARLAMGHGNANEKMILLAVLLAFLVLNARYPRHGRASLFMGDSGSYFLGFALAYVVTRLGTGSEPVLPPIAVAWLVALPIFNTVRVMMTRVRRGVSPFHADRDHLHYLLVDYRGWTVSRTTWSLAALNLVIGGVGLAGAFLGVSERDLFLGLLALLPLLFWLTRWARADHRSRRRRFDCKSLAEADQGAD